MKLQLIPILFIMLLSEIKTEFTFFEVEPHKALLNSNFAVTMQVSHPPGQLDCDYSIIDPIAKFPIYKSNFLKATIENGKMVTYHFNLGIIPISLIFPLFKISYHCQYLCVKSFVHHVTREYFLFPNPDIHFDPMDYFPYVPKINFIVDNSEKIINYLSQKYEEQIVNLQGNLASLVNTVTSDTEFYLQQSILLNNLFNVTTCSDENCHDFLKSSHEKVIDKLTDVLNCETIDQTIFNHSAPHKVLSLSAATFLYQNFNADLYKNSTFEKGTVISECLSVKGFDLLSKLNEKLQNEQILFQNVTSDYLMSLSYVTSNNLGILKNKLYENVTTSKNTSLVVDETTLKVKNLVEENSLLLLKNNFVEMEEKIATDNLVFMNKKFKRSKRRNLLSSLDLDNSTHFENITIENNKTKINISIPIDYMIEKYAMQTAKLGLVLYEKYPLLASNNKNYSENVISIKLYNENDEHQKVENLTNPINIIFQRPDKSYNVCLYYDSFNNTWNDANCKTIEISDDLLLCQCNHLTDFTISKFNPIEIIDDIVNLLNDTNWMTSFDEFKNLNASNAIVIYIYVFLFVLFFVGLIFTIKFDRQPKRNSFFIDKSHLIRESFCTRLFSRKRIIEEMINVKSKTESSLIPAKKKMMKKFFSENVDNDDLIEKIRRKTMRVNADILFVNKHNNSENSNEEDFSSATVSEDEINHNNTETHMKKRRVTVMSEKVLLENNQEIEYENIIENQTQKELKIFKKNLYRIFKMKKQNKTDDNWEVENAECSKNDLETPLHKEESLNAEEKENENENYLEEPTRESDLISQKPLKLNNEFFFKTSALLKIIRQYNLYTALVLNIDYKLNKTDILSLIFFNLTSSFAVCALFSPCNSINGSSDETSYGYTFINRSLAVSILTLIIVKIPTKIFSLLLKKRFLYKGEDVHQNKFRAWAYVIHVFVYFLFLLAFAWCIINTTWVYLRNEGVGRENVFLAYFFIHLLTKVILKIIYFMIKSVLFYFIMKNPEVPFWKVVMITIGFITITF